MDYGKFIFLSALQGLIHHYLGSQRLAEKTLREAAKIDPNSHQTWYVYMHPGKIDSDVTIDE